MSKGIDFEEKALGYLRALFEQLNFHVIEARQQEPGTQNGFDIMLCFLDDSGEKRSFYFECKDYKTKISWNAISDKITQIDASSLRPDGYIALSPHVDFSNIVVNVLKKQQERVQFPIIYWTPAACVKEYFSLDTPFFEYVYKKQSVTSEIEKKLTRQKIRGIIIDMLRQKDKLASTSFTKELTLKIPRINEEDIVGRADELKELHQLLFNKKQVVVVNGLGGVGKTTLAQGYFSKYADDYKHVAWISQLTNDIVNDIANAEQLAENLAVSRQGKETTQLFQEIICRFKTIPDGPNLLILDNVDENLAKLKDYLPGQPHWHVLTTSRKRIEGFYAKELGFLSPKNAIALFKKHCPRITSDEQIAELVKAVDYHTLTIEILAKTAQYQKTDIGTLKRAIKDDLRANVYIEHKGEKIDKVRSYLSSIFNISGLNEEGIWMMKQFTCLPAEFHFYKELLELIDPDENKKQVFAEICNRLVEQGWLLYNAETEAYKMHLIVQEVAVRQLLPELHDIGGLLNKISRNLEVDQSKDNPIDKFRWIPFGYALLNNFPDDTSDKIALLQNNLAMVLQDLGDYAGARALQEKAMRSAEQNFGPDHPNTAVSYSNLALVLQYLGDYGGARALQEKAMRSAEQNFGPDHPTCTVNYSNLALVLQDLGDYASARALLEKAICLAEQNFGPDHPITAVNYSNLALVLKDLGDYAGAQALLEKAIRLAEQNFGPDHPTTAVRYSNLATVLNALGDYVGARALLEKAICLAEQNFGPDHPTTMQSYSNLALVLNALGDYVGARALLEKAMRSAEQNFGPDHPNTAVSYSNLALVLKDLGDYAGARVLREKAMRSAAQNFGPNHPTTAVSYSNLATVLQALGNLAEAFKLSEKSLLIFKKTLPEGHPYIEGAQRIYNSIKSSL